MTLLQTNVLAEMRKRIGNFDSLSSGEKVLQVMAYLADVIEVREEKGNNHGRYIDDFLKESGGLNPGNPWCAASLNWCAEMVNAPNPDKADAAVIGWRNWAKANGRLVDQPKRGYLCGYITPGKTTGHIGIVRSVDGEFVRSIEGNTSSGQSGSQRDGDGLFRRTRDKDTWKFYIKLD